MHRACPSDLDRHRPQRHSAVHRWDVRLGVPRSHAPGPLVRGRVRYHVAVRQAILKGPHPFICGWVMKIQVRDVQQGDGGEQGDALMPALFAFGQHNALVTLQLQLPSQTTSTVCSPECVLPIFQVLEFELWVHSRIQIHQGKTQFWNKGGVLLLGWETLAAHALRSDPDAMAR